jgi:hypothetical protein
MEAATTASGQTISCMAQVWIMHTYTFIYTQTYVYIHTYIHTHIHTYMHTYTHTVCMARKGLHGLSSKIMLTCAQNSRRSLHTAIRVLSLMYLYSMTRVTVVGESTLEVRVHAFLFNRHTRKFLCGFANLLANHGSFKSLPSSCACMQTPRSWRFRYRHFPSSLVHTMGCMLPGHDVLPLHTT